MPFCKNKKRENHSVIPAIVWTVRWIGRKNDVQIFNGERVKIYVSVEVAKRWDVSLP